MESPRWVSAEVYGKSSHFELLAVLQYEAPGSWRVHCRDAALMAGICGQQATASCGTPERPGFEVLPDHRAQRLSDRMCTQSRLLEKLRDMSGKLLKYPSEGCKKRVGVYTLAKEFDTGSGQPKKKNWQIQKQVVSSAPNAVGLISTSSELLPSTGARKGEEG